MTKILAAMLMALLVPNSRGEATPPAAPAGVVSNFIREVSALAGTHAELADFPEAVKRLGTYSAVEFKRGIKPFPIFSDTNTSSVLTKRRIRPSDCGTNGIFLQFVLDDGTHERQAPIDAVTWFPNLRLTLYANVVLWEKASSELKQKLEDIVARHKAMLAELDKKAPRKASEARARSAAVMPALAADSSSIASGAVNSLGTDLLQQSAKPDANFLLSPFSLQSALAMTYAGAAGETRDEMARVLHYPTNEAAMHRSFAALQRALTAVMERGTGRNPGGGTEGGPILLTVANRLFGQQGYEFREPFLSLTKETYHAPLQPTDFIADPAAAAKLINAWVEGQTKQRIRDLLSPTALTPDTKIVLVNAVYFKASWRNPFWTSATSPRPFHVRGGKASFVPTMSRTMPLGYGNYDGFTAVTIPYSDEELQLLILLPDKVDGLKAMEDGMSSAQLAKCANLASRQVDLYLPKFKLEPPTLPLKEQLMALGLKLAFDVPPGAANFDRMAPRHLFLTEVFHKTFILLDEAGTEAAAATAVPAPETGPSTNPPEVRVDRPFLFAIQHRPSGACLFLGHLVDPGAGQKEDK